MPTYYPPYGFVLVQPHSDEEKSAGGVFFPDERRRKRQTGIAIIHDPTEWWLCFNEPLRNKHIVFEKWSWRILRLGDLTLYLVPEGAVLGVLTNEQGEDVMATRDELLEEIVDTITQQLKDDLPEKGELSDDNLDSAQAIVSGIDVHELAETIDDGTDEDDE